MDISIVVNLAPFVEMMMSKRIFANKHICRGCGYFTWVVYFVSAYSESSSVILFLLGLYTAHKLPVCYIFYAIVWYFLSCDERDCVSRVFICPPTPFSSCLNLFVEDVFQFFNFGFFMSFL